MLLRSESSVAKNGEERPLLQHTTISSLHDDLVLNCLARVSRSYYPTLSLVSTKFRSLIASPEIYKVRSLLGLTESCLYVCLDFRNSDLRWFTLYRRPNTSENILVQISSRKGDRASLVAVGSSIYSIGGLVRDPPSSSVSILDCRSHTWHQAPNMSVARTSCYVAVHVIDGKIYVIGGRLMKDFNSSNWIEVFDPSTQTWNSLSNQVFDDGFENIHSTAFNGKINMYVGYGKAMAYNTKDGTCEPIKELELDLCRAPVLYSHCVVDDVLFCFYDKQEFIWFDTKTRLWRDMKGLEGMPKIVEENSVNLANYGGKMAVLWSQSVSSSGCDEKKEIWCAVIAVERRNSEEDEIWGTVEWFGVVLTVPRSCRFLHGLAATL